MIERAIQLQSRRSKLVAASRQSKLRPENWLKTSQPSTTAATTQTITHFAVWRRPTGLGYQSGSESPCRLRREPKFIFDLVDAVFDLPCGRTRSLGIVELLLRR